MKLKSIVSEALFISRLMYIFIKKFMPLFLLLAIGAVMGVERPWLFGLVFLIASPWALSSVFAEVDA